MKRNEWSSRKSKLFLQKWFNTPLLVHICTLLSLSMRIPLLVSLSVEPVIWFFFLFLWVTSWTLQEILTSLFSLCSFVFEFSSSALSKCCLKCWVTFPRKYIHPAYFGGSCQLFALWCWWRRHWILILWAVYTFLKYQMVVELEVSYTRLSAQVGIDCLYDWSVPNIVICPNYFLKSPYL